jgi:phosphopantetheinyl transferase
MSLNTLSKRLTPLQSLHKECQLWLVNLENIEASEVAVALTALDDKEFKRMNNFLNITHQREFAVCRFFGKKIIGDALGICARDTIFFYSEKGKPYLKNTDIEFNISHSKKFALIGKSKHKIGVDIEFINKDEDILNTMDFFLSQEEKDWVLEDNLWNRFYQMWTMKEARLKCDGDGITVSFFPSLMRDEKNKWQYPGYSMSSSLINEDYAYSICTLGP